MSAIWAAALGFAEAGFWIILSTLVDTEDSCRLFRLRLIEFMTFDSFTKEAPLSQSLTAFWAVAESSAEDTILDHSVKYWHCILVQSYWQKGKFLPMFCIYDTPSIR